MERLLRRSIFQLRVPNRFVKKIRRVLEECYEIRQIFEGVTFDQEKNGGK